jgi:Domain of unknown function (DUF4338)
MVSRRSHLGWGPGPGPCRYQTDSGGRLRYLLWDEHNEKLIGLIAIGDPVFNLSVRDNLIGWNVRDRGAIGGSIAPNDYRTSIYAYRLCHVRGFYLSRERGAHYPHVYFSTL